jgi:hypothetical protein
MGQKDLCAILVKFLRCGMMETSSRYSKRSSLLPGASDKITQLIEELG